MALQRSERLVDHTMAVEGGSSARIYLTGVPGVGVGAGRLAAPRGMPSSLLATLLIRPNCVVETDSLIGFLWPREKPRSAESNLRQYVSRLRRFLEKNTSWGGGRIISATGGYVFDVRREELDITRFGDLADLGRQALEAGESQAARDQLSAAVDLWSGPLCQGVALAPQLEIDVLHWEELRLTAHQMLVQARMQLGEYQQAIMELRQLLAGNPLREELWGMLMLAFYRSYRRADALEAFRHGRRKIVQELGIEPTSQLQQLHQDILNETCPLEGFPWLHRVPIAQNVGV